jgi:quinol-cytochrome oxidoreductase complex cytochrome b subunit
MDAGPDDPRKYLRNFLLHFRPSMVPERTLRFSFTWGLGVAATTLIGLLLLSGLLLKFVYEPVPGRAYESILYINTQVPLGQLLRNVHRWSGNGLLLVVFLHFLRVFYTGAFMPPRQVNWIVGLGLFAAVILSNFTGYLLPWDQVAYWAITISTSMLDYVPVIGSGLKSWLLGGSEPGAASLLNFYAIHTAILPIVLLFAIPFHFWKIRKANGIVIPRRPDEAPGVTGDMIRTVPHLFVREATVAIAVLAIVLAVAITVNAPLAEQANPGLSPNPTKAPWYFMGIQELLMHFHPVFALLVIPGILMLGLLALPWLRYDANVSGIWFGSATGRKTALLALVCGAMLAVAGVLASEHGLSDPGILGGGLVPFALAALLTVGFYYLVRKLFSANVNEAVQAVFTLLISVFVTLTVVGVWFRGSGMQLMWAG